MLPHAQAAAAAARAAAQAACLQQLQEQAVAAARRYMAAWHIARAWQAYKLSPARVQKVAAAVCLQAACRGAAVRRLVQRLQVRQQLLAELQQALLQGQQPAVQRAADQARQAGVFTMSAHQAACYLLQA